ncbi:MAG TPA: hypothetical protein VFB76_04195 [Candidatus Angelobacter sp.]|nr:hypothetical protein [Candidatus Angelobacter sp.]
MKRRDLLKAFSVLPIAAALSECRESQYKATPPPKHGGEAVHTLQILLEGTFAVVLRQDINRLTAFVPRPDPKAADLAHYFYFNDPEHNTEPRKADSKGYHFELGAEGLRKYPNAKLPPYINPDFNDFVAETQKWRLLDSLVTINLPIPRSINFMGRPLHVEFGPNALKHTGLMPTNHILEYGVEDVGKIGMKCDDPEGHCANLPFCSPGIARFYFGVRPVMNGLQERQKHAVAFFNFMLERAFPELRQKYELKYIERADDTPESSRGAYPTAFNKVKQSPVLVPEILDSASPRPRLVRVASMVDCQAGGILVKTNKAPIG